MRRYHLRLKLLAATITCGCMLASASCVSRKFIDDIATNTAGDLADILIDALIIQPIDDAVNDRS